MTRRYKQKRKNINNEVNRPVVKHGATTLLGLGLITAPAHAAVLVNQQTMQIRY